MSYYLTEYQRYKNLLGATVAATDDTVETASMDMVGEDGGYLRAVFLVRMGTLTAGGTTVIDVQQSADDSTFATLAAPTLSPVHTTGSDKLFVLEVNKPTDRYVRLQFTRADENAEIDSVIGIRADGREGVITQADASTVFSAVATTPAEE